MMDYKKLAEEAREFSVLCSGAHLELLSDRLASYANAIEELLELVESMKHPHIKIQIDYEELTIKEVCDRLERLKKERDKAISDFHKAVKENGICSSCKHQFKECVGICMCDADGEDHWEWEGLDG